MVIGDGAPNVRTDAPDLQHSGIAEESGTGTPGRPRMVAIRAAGRHEQFFAGCMPHAEIAVSFTRNPGEFGASPPGLRTSC